MVRRIFAIAAVITFIAVFLAPPAAEFWTIPMFLLYAALAYGLAHEFSSLTVKVDDKDLRWWFGRRNWEKTVPLADVATAEPVVNRWWWGWGIRYYGKGWHYSVSGLDAVEIVLNSGKHIRIGTDDPQRLSAALQRKVT